MSVYAENEEGEWKRYALGVAPDDINDTKLFHLWKAFEHKMLCMPNTNVPLQHPHQPLRNFGGMTLFARDWTQNYAQLRNEVEQIPWP